ncbi:MAG: ribosome silencing factor [Dehalococcoidia bacterium]
MDVLTEHLALDLALIDVSKASSFTDFFVIATVQSPLQFRALTEYLEKALGPEGCDLRRHEGTPDSGWVLLDFADLIVHLFTPEKREYYKLEELWGKQAPVVRFLA